MDLEIFEKYDLPPTKGLKLHRRSQSGTLINLAVYESSGTCQEINRLYRQKPAGTMENGKPPLFTHVDKIH